MESLDKTRKSGGADKSKNHENRVSQMLNGFAFDMHKLVSENGDENVIFSPYSIFEALAMVNTGADSNTKKEIETVLKLHSGENLPQLLKAIRDNILSADGATIQIANKGWIADNMEVTKSFNENLSKYFSVDMGTEAFAANGEVSRQNINNWVASKTGEMIKDLFPAGAINCNTKLVLANAIYFKGQWDDSFDRNATRARTFYLPDGNRIEGVQFMFKNGSFNALTVRNVQLLELPYRGKSFSMVVAMPMDPERESEQSGQGMMLPIRPPKREPKKEAKGKPNRNKKQIKNLAELNETINADLLEKWLRKLSCNSVTDVDLYMPKFEIKQGISLKSSLETLGVHDLFDANDADLSPITGGRDLYCSAAVHQAYMKVDEEGTVAAAATGFATLAMCMPMPKQQIRIDRPFLVFLLHKPSNSIIFSGKVVNPKA